MSDVSVPHPRSNGDLRGHEAGEKAFLDAWNSGRLAHSWLICGPKGIGKATLAYRIARFVLSSTGGAVDMFGGGPTSLVVDEEDRGTKMVLNGTHPDLKIIERGWSDDNRTKRARDITVEDIRGIGEFLSLTPSLGGWRVVIVDCADEMNRNAANAILKILEEPPKKSLIFLLSHSPGRLLTTIRSRCRRLVLGPLPDPVVEALLAQYCPDLAQADKAGLIQLAEGSIGRAITLVEQDGLAFYQDMTSVLQSFPTLDFVALHSFADRVTSRGKAEGEGAWATISELFLWWLSGIIRQRPDSQGLESWLGVWEKVRGLFAKVDAVNLDRKQALLTALLLVEKTARMS